MTGIYKITSPSGRIYIGQSINIYKRWRKYKSFSCLNQPKICNSIKKYGAEKHIFEIIEECEVEILTEREGYYQDLFDSINSGLNLRRVKYSDKSGYDSDETKRKRSEALKGRKQNPEHIDKLRVNHFKIGNIPHNKNIPRTQEQKKHQSIILTGRKDTIEQKELKSKNSGKAKIVICKLTGKKWKSASKCSKELGINRITLTGMLNGNIRNTRVKTLTYLK